MKTAISPFAVGLFSFEKDESDGGGIKDASRDFKVIFSQFNFTTGARDEIPSVLCSDFYAEQIEGEKNGTYHG